MALHITNSANTLNSFLPTCAKTFGYMGPITYKLKHCIRLKHKLIRISRCSQSTLYPIVLSNSLMSHTQRRWSGVRTVVNHTGMGAALQQETTPTTSDTIYALSSGQGKCGVAVIRVSGPEAGSALVQVGRFRQLPQPRSAILRMLHDPTTGEALDKGLVIWFPGPHSFTGEDSCELQVHGGPAVVTAVLTSLGAMPALRHAEPGDFTKRAFTHGRLDLTEVEGLADLIHAETEAQRRQALRQMDGALSRLYQAWRLRLIKCAANVAAFIDFSEDELIEDDVLDEVTQSVRLLRDELTYHLADGRRGERLRDGVHVAIIGEPNVGKSSILNALCRRPAAIVSPSAGTTRDVVESAVNLAGYPVVLSDTAGLRDATDLVEQEGVRRAKQRAQTADLRVLVIDARQLLPRSEKRVQLETFLGHHLQSLGITNSHSSKSKDDTSRSVLPQPSSPEEHLHPQALNKYSGDVPYVQTGDPPVAEQAVGDVSLLDSDEGVLVVVNKCDLVGEAKVKEAVSADRLQWTCLSCVTEQGMDRLLELLTEKVKLMCGNPASGNPSLTQARHRDHLTACLKALNSYLEDQNHDLVVGGEHLRQAVYQMGKLTGKITSDEVLDVVFRDFCIGK